MFCSKEQYKDALESCYGYSVDLCKPTTRIYVFCNYLAAACGGVFYHKDTKAQRHKDIKL